MFPVTCSVTRKPQPLKTCFKSMAYALVDLNPLEGPGFFMCPKWLKDVGVEHSRRVRLRGPWAVYKANVGGDAGDRRRKSRRPPPRRLGCNTRNPVLRADLKVDLIPFLKHLML